MTVIRRETLVALALCLTLYHLPRAEAALNCYTSQPADDGSIKEECGMQTGCIKKFYQKTQKVVEKGCFLVPSEDQCFVEEKTGLGVCYCTTDLCNTSPARLTGFYGLLLPLLTSTVYLIIK